MVGKYGVTIKKGDIFPLNKGGTVTVLDYENSDNVVIVHNDTHKYVQKVQAGHLKRGNVKNPHFPSVFGVGYIGVGDFSPSIGGKHTQVYKKWQSMIERNYSRSYHKKKPSYADCTVHPDWHNFQVFAEWYTKQKFCDSDYQLDKDILVKGNKVYSAETCCLVPKEVNNFAKADSFLKGLPLGVSFRSGRYSARIMTNKKSAWIGFFDTPEEASEAYEISKSKKAKVVAEGWKDFMCKRSYNALLQW